MRVLAIHSGHNATVCYAVDGKILDVLSEEKFTNIKNDQNFPIKCLTFLKNKYDISSVDIIACCGTYNQIFIGNQPAVNITSEFLRKFRTFKSVIIKLLGKFNFFHKFLEYFEKIRVARNTNINQTKYIEYFNELQLFKYEKFEFIDHHTCHAYAALFSGYIHDEDALCFTLDGMGDQYCAKIFHHQGGQINEISKTFWHSSIGLIYSSVTRYLGMKKLEHEYKVMGLAAYPDKKYWLNLKKEVFDPILTFNHDTLEFTSTMPTHMLDQYFHDRLRNHRFDNIAAALQHFTEDLVSRWISIATSKYPKISLAFGGGVFMNVKLNKVLNDTLGEERDLFFMPSAGDESLPIGAAYYTFLRNNIDTKPLENLFLGLEFSNIEISEEIDKKYDAELTYVYSDNIEQVIAKLLSEHKVVARIYGRGEWGARSLGNRAILANPSRMEAFHFVNNAVKMRDFWMPFAPSILEEAADRYVHGSNISKAEFMILGFDSTKLGRENLVAATHQKDKTIRPQIVNATSNPSFHNILTEFEKITNIGGVLNTSYNLHGFPLADSLNSIFSTFLNSDLEYLAFQDLLITKK